ncbi:MAG TPA: hypothetical protein VHO28_16565 [Ignavibacteriales bacterium]|nr:hypothetical protein [Ignavibacteriales bacterium]
MKRFANIFLVILFSALYAGGCGEDSPTQNPDSNEHLLVKGQMHGWTWGKDKLISFTESDPNGNGISLAVNNINREGSFMLVVPPPPAFEMKPIKEFFYKYDGYNEHPAISDTTVKFFKGGLRILKNGELVGGTEWVCYRGVDPVKGGHLESYKAGYYYFDKDVEIKGWLGNTNYSGINYFITAKAGWNIILDKYVNGGGVYIINNRDLNGYYQYYGLMVIPDSLKWGGGVVVPN